MKKIISLLCVLCSLFLVSCKRDRIVEVKEETKPMQEKLSKRKNVDDIEDKEKKNILRILYSQDVKGIMWYFRFDAYPIIFPETKLEIADEYKEKISNSFFERFFVEDIEMQEKLKELPLEYRWTIYEKLK